MSEERTEPRPWCVSVSVSVWSRGEGTTVPYSLAASVHAQAAHVATAWLLQLGVQKEGAWQTGAAIAL